MTEMPSDLVRNVGGVVLERVGISGNMKGFFGNRENRITHGKDSNKV